MAMLEQRLALYQKQETVLQFDRFSNKDAWELGTLMVNAARALQVCPAFQIDKGGYTVFRYGFDGTNTHNAMWLKRKANTVAVTHKSSLHVGALLEKTGETLGGDWYLPPEEYAFLGGGFPLTLRGTGVVGAVCCSGLPHQEDHAMVVRCLAAFMDLEEATVLQL